jgi:ATP-binding cassette subfamily F protein 3
MSIIQADYLSKSYGAGDVFEGVSFSIPRQARIALVGPNGVGKTTLFRIIMGLEEPDSGHLHKARSLQMGYLPQEMGYSRSKRSDLGISLWESCLHAFQDLIRLEEQILKLERAMSDPRQVEEAMVQYGSLQEEFELRGGYTYQSRMQSVLGGLGFTRADYDRPLASLSGGEQTRAQLARLLLEDPDLLILDEPTNHLDIEAVEWLEAWMREWPGTAMIVSHDRYFLDRVVDTIFELTPVGLKRYRGNYSQYFLQREDEIAYQNMQYHVQQEFIQKEEDYIQRNIAGQNSRQAQGRRKRLQRLTDENALEFHRHRRTTQIDFGDAARSGDIVLRTERLVIAHPDGGAPLFTVPDLEFRRGNRVALIGPNGAGKTTFLKTLLGEIAPLSGDIRLGSSLRIGYFEQAHSGLDPDKTVLEEILAAGIDPSIQRARAYLAKYLFSGDEVHKKVAALSGGERGRLALAKLIMTGANFLLLDEPTNHLDLPSQEALEIALSNFGGSILLVSHDRYLIDVLADYVWIISPDEQRLEVFEGGYRDYKAMHQARMREKDPPTSPERPPSARKGSRRAVEAMEAEITDLEAELAHLTAGLSLGGETEQIIALSHRYAAVDSRLKDLYARWEDMAREGDTA